jgi:predicted transcriptional regulator
MSLYHVELVSETDAALDKLAENTSSKTEAIQKAIFVAAWIEEKQNVW